MLLKIVERRWIFFYSIFSWQKNTPDNGLTYCFGLFKYKWTCL